MKYSSSVYIGSQERVDFSPVESTLLPNGFKVEYISENTIKFKGPLMQSTKEAPIRGATHISFKVERGQLQLNAKLGGVLFMSLFVCLFPPVLVFFIGGPNVNYLNAVWPWLIIGPIAAYWLRYRTVKALNTLLENTVYLKLNKS
jgi:hypothetical protein